VCSSEETENAQKTHFETPELKIFYGEVPLPRPPLIGRGHHSHTHRNALGPAASLFSAPVGSQKSKYAPASTGATSQTADETAVKTRCYEEDK